MSEFAPGQDWDVEAHVRLLRENGGPSSGYTADLLERLHRSHTDLLKFAKRAGGMTSRRHLVHCRAEDDVCRDIHNRALQIVAKTEGRQP